MSKCDLCYDRTGEGLKPMCASVCPSQALFFGTAEEIAELRPASAPTNEFVFGEQTVATRVQMLVPKRLVQSMALRRLMSLELWQKSI